MFVPVYEHTISNGKKRKKRAPHFNFETKCAAVKKKKKKKQVRKKPLLEGINPSHIVETFTVMGNGSFEGFTRRDLK